MSNDASVTSIPRVLRRELLRLARKEDNQAALEAAAVPYWAAGPSSIQGHREAAVVLRAEADRLLELSEAG